MFCACNLFKQRVKFSKLIISWSSFSSIRPSCFNKWRHWNLKHRIVSWEMKAIIPFCGKAKMFFPNKFNSYNQGFCQIANSCYKHANNPVFLDHLHQLAMQFRACNCCKIIGASSYLFSCSPTKTPNQLFLTYTYRQTYQICKLRFNNQIFGLFEQFPLVLFVFWQTNLQDKL
jgi:hypothetical protein